MIYLTTKLTARALSGVTRLVDGNRWMMRPKIAKLLMQRQTTADRALMYVEKWHADAQDLSEDYYSWMKG